MRSKARLTITLPQDLLRQIDRLIDKQTIRNRSHAIEMLVRQSLRPQVETAVLLAGGQLQDGPPPALLSINKRKLISLTIEHLARYGVTDFIILAGQNEAAIRAVIGEGESWGVTVSYVREDYPLGTGGALKLAEQRLQNGPFLVVHGDILTSINIADFIDFYQNEKTLAAIAVKPRQAERNYGQVILQGNRITDFYENGRDVGISIVNTGVYLLQPRVLSLIPEGQPAKLETDVFPRLAEMGELSAFFFQGVWFDISAPENYQKAQARWNCERRLIS